MYDTNNSQECSDPHTRSDRDMESATAFLKNGKNQKRTSFKSERVSLRIPGTDRVVQAYATNITGMSEKAIKEKKREMLVDLRIKNGCLEPKYVKKVGDIIKWYRNDLKNRFHDSDTASLINLIEYASDIPLKKETIARQLWLIRLAQRRTQAAPSVADYEMLALYAAFNRAVKLGVFSYNPVDAKTQKQYKKNHQGKTAPEIPEKKLEAFFDDAPYAIWPAIIIAISNMVRKGEVLSGKIIESSKLLGENKAIINSEKKGANAQREAYIPPFMVPFYMGLPEENRYICPVFKNGKIVEASKSYIDKIVSKSGKKIGAKGLRYHHFRGDTFTKFLQVGISMNHCLSNGGWDNRNTPESTYMRRDGIIGPKMFEEIRRMVQKAEYAIDDFVWGEQGVFWGRYLFHKVSHQWITIDSIIEKAQRANTTPQAFSTTFSEMPPKSTEEKGKEDANKGSASAEDYSI